jgi:hypothetical protein
VHCFYPADEFHLLFDYLHILGTLLTYKFDEINDFFNNEASGCLNFSFTKLFLVFFTHRNEEADCLQANGDIGESDVFHGSDIL